MTAPTNGLEKVYSLSELEALGEGSRWRIIRHVREGSFPPPDYHDGRYPRWLASTIQRHREALIAQREE